MKWLEGVGVSNGLHFPSVAKWLLARFQEIDLKNGNTLNLVCRVGMGAAKIEGGWDEGYGLLMKLSETGNGCGLVTATLLSTVKGGGAGGELGSKLLLLQYCRFVERVRLSNDLKLVLFGASKNYWEEFMDCEGGDFDTKFEASLGDLKSAEFGAAACSSLMDIAKNHPLVFCRKLGMVGRMLEEDGRWIKGGAVAGEFGKGKGKEIVVKEMVKGGEEGA
jgi:hypothetical protein